MDSGRYSCMPRCGLVLLRALLPLLAFVSPLQSTLATPPSKDKVTERSFIEDLFTPRKELPFSIIGVNAFANDARFGTIRSQFREVRNTLGVRDIRILFAWNDQVQPTPAAKPFWGFYDEIARSLPSDTRAVVVITGVPSWMENPTNWQDSNPRKTFVERWVKPVVNRYKRFGAITTFEVWNEPNNESFPENVTLNVLTSPENFVELTALSYAAIKQIAPRKRSINGATTAIAQSFPDTLTYNKNMISAGILSFVDAFNIHFYGTNVERILAPGGIKDFLTSLTKPIWITEIGKQGTTQQLEYAQRIIPFLIKSAPQVRKVFLYQFTEATSADSTYGLRNLTPGRALSDLYIHLRDRARAANNR